MKNTATLALLIALALGAGNELATEKMGDRLLGLSNGLMVPP